MRKWTLVPLAAALWMAACSSDLKKPPVTTSDGDSGVILPPGAGGGGGDGGADAGDAGDAGACNTVAQIGNLVDKVSFPTQAPAPAGGTIVDGTYRLTEFSIYDPAQPGGVTGVQIKATMVISNGTIEDVTFGAGGEARSNGTYSVSGTQMTTTTTCPLGKGSRTFGFTAAGAQLQFIFPTSNEVLTFQRQ
jgi:hypothetical protein